MQVTSADGTLIGYEVVGQGDPLVLVDGALCYRSSGPMRPLAAELAGDAKVVLYDRRGRGESGDTSPYEVEREVEDLAALIDAVGGQVDLCGISSGGALALLVAGRLGPARVRTLAVYEPPYSPESGRAAADAYVRELTGALALPDHDLAVRLFLERVGVPGSVISGMEQSEGWAGMVELAPTLRYDALVLGDGALPAGVAAQVAVPVLVAAGSASSEFLQYGARALAQAVSHSEFRVLEGQGHDADPAVLAAALREFLSRNGRQRQPS